MKTTPMNIDTAPTPGQIVRVTYRPSFADYPVQGRVVEADEVSFDVETFQPNPLDEFLPHEHFATTVYFADVNSGDAVVEVLQS